MKSILILLSLFTSSLSFAKDDSVKTTCVRVINGDTIVVLSGDEVKLIGVDTPPFHRNVKLVNKSLGQKAWEFTNDHLKDKEIKLEFDSNNESTNHIDKEGKLLAYV